MKISHELHTALCELCSMTAPSVAQILRKHGYVYESKIVDHCIQLCTQELEQHAQQ